MVDFRLLVFFALIAGANSARAEILPSAIEPPTAPCNYFTADAEYVNFFLEMRLEEKTIPMSVPKIFLEDKFDQQNGAKHAAQLFRVTVDSFEPVTRRETSKLNRQGIHNWMTFIVSDRIEMIDLASVALSSAEWGLPKEPFISYQLVPSDFGLLRALPKGNEPVETVYFFLEAGGNPETIISCDIQESFLYHNCTQQFRTLNMDVSVDYRIEQFPNWRSIQSKIDSFLGCAVTPN